MLQTCLLVTLLGQAPAPESGSLDAQLRRLSDSLAAGLARVDGDVRARRYAVLPFTDVGTQAKKAQLGLVVMDAVATNLQRDHSLIIVERERLNDVLGEQALQQSGLVNVEQTARMGQLLDADAIIVGQVADGGEYYRVSARVVDVQSNTLLASTEATLPARELIAFSADSVVLRSRSDAVFRSALIPGWGQSYNRQPIKSAIFLGAMGVALVGAVVSLGALGGLSAYYLTCNQECQDGKGRQLLFIQLGLLTFTTLRVLIPQAALLAALFAGLGGATWTVNVVDAYLSGVDG